MVLQVAEGSGSGSWASSPGNRKSMQGNRSRDTKPELAVRSAVHRRGIRFRVSARPQPELPRTADLVLRKSRIAVFVDGCYWHGCPDHYTQPSTNSEYWADKIARNIERDAETTAYLRHARVEGSAVLGARGPGIGGPIKCKSQSARPLEEPTDEHRSPAPTCTRPQLSKGRTPTSLTRPGYAAAKEAALARAGTGGPGLLTRGGASTVPRSRAGGAT